MKVNNVKTKDTKKSYCDHKAIACSLYVPYHWGAILKRDCILRNTTECLFLNLCYGECELGLLRLVLGHNREKRFYYFKHTVHTIQGSNQKNLKHTGADRKNTVLTNKECTPGETTLNVGLVKRRMNQKWSHKGRIRKQ